VFGFRMFAVKNSMKRHDARSPAAAIKAGNLLTPTLASLQSDGTRIIGKVFACSRSERVSFPVKDTPSR
jgi:hypothetical protein